MEEISKRVNEWPCSSILLPPNSLLPHQGLTLLKKKKCLASATPYTLNKASQKINKLAICNMATIEALYFLMTYICFCTGLVATSGCPLTALIMQVAHVVRGKYQFVTVCSPLLDFTPVAEQLVNQSGNRWWCASSALVREKSAFINGGGYEY